MMSLAGGSEIFIYTGWSTFQGLPQMFVSTDVQDLWEGNRGRPYVGFHIFGNNFL